jgi:hypothetical protein
MILWLMRVFYDKSVSWGKLMLKISGISELTETLRGEK